MPRVLAHSAIVLVFGTLAAVSAADNPQNGSIPKPRPVPPPPTNANSANKSIPDSEITLAIERRLQRKAIISRDTIDVKTKAGIVTLTGTVDSMLAKTTAKNVAQQTKGVRSVVDQLSVTRSNQTDETVLKHVEVALGADPALAGSKITAAVKDGVVTLTGKAESWTQRSIAEQDTMGTSGVISIQDQIEVSPLQNRSDTDIAADVRDRLKWDGRIRDSQLTVQVKDGKVLLSGIIGSAIERWWAYTDAWVPGVRSVSTDDVRVDRWWDGKGLRRSPTEYARTDDAIEQAIKSAFRNDPRLTSSKPGISVNDGVVTLSGTVDHLLAKRAAAMDARNTVGVRRVHNLIKVRPRTAIPDADILRNVQQALSHDPHVNRYDVHVGVWRGYVSLRGAVDSPIELAQAGEDAAHVPGVIGVRNYLTVSPPLEFGSGTPADITARDNEIREDIQDELKWDPFVAANEVVVTVRGGVATLTGFVDTLAEKQAATRCAFDGGARQVINELNVRPGPGKP